MHTQGKGETTLLQFNSNLRFYKNPKAMGWTLIDSAYSGAHMKSKKVHFMY